MNAEISMSLFRKYKEPEQIAIDKSNAAASSLDELLQTLEEKGLYAFKDLSTSEQRRVWFWSKTIIRQYRLALERNPANLRAAEDLPFSKAEVKLAIKLALPFYAQKKVQSMVKNLKSMYKELGCFQSLEAGDREKLRAVYRRRDKASVRPYRELLEIHEKYMETVISEKKSLLAEINTYADRLKLSR
jgi:hypothetical protein